MSVDSGNTLEFNGRRRYLSALAGHSCRLSASYHFSPVAQLVEQAAVNRLVVGSSPTGGARFCSAYLQYRPVHRKRREVRLPAFLHICLSRNDLRRIESPAATLRFERDRPGSERNPQGPFRTPESRTKTL